MHADRPSATALLIARATICVAHEPRLGRFVPDHAAEACEWFAREAGVSPRTLGWLRQAWYRRLARWVERRTVPGIMLHYQLRKRAIEDQVRSALATGVRRVIVLAAGFDTLAWRLHRAYPGVAFIEVDHPATQRVKQAALARHDPPASNLRFVALDFTHEPLATALEPLLGNADPRASLFIAEGITMYLTTPELDAMLALVRRHGRLVFTFMERRGDDIHFRDSGWLTRLWLRWRREMFRWGVAPNELAAFLQARGLTLRTLITGERLRERYLANDHDVVLAYGEHLAVADPA